MDWLLQSADACQTVTVFMSFSAYIPQWTTLFKNKSSENFSIRAWVLWLAASVLGLFYAVMQVVAYGTGFALLISSAANLVMIGVTLSLILYFRKEPILEDELPLAEAVA